MMKNQLAAQARSASRHAFTLIELLVVIAIISVLAALLMPALRAAIESSRSAFCMNTQKQLGLTFSYYMDDHNGYYPHWRYKQNTDGSGTAYYPCWDAKIAAYLDFKESEITRGASDAPVGQTLVFWCPQQPHPSPTTRGRLNYGANYLLGATHKSNGVLSESRVTRSPSQVALLMDNEYGSSLFGKAWNGAYHTYQIGYGIGFRHSGGLNILFLDYHTKWIHEGQYIDSGGPAGICRWWNE